MPLRPALRASCPARPPLACTAHGAQQGLPVHVPALHIMLRQQLALLTSRSSFLSSGDQALG